MLFPINK